MDATLLKGLRLLEILARSDGARGVSEVAREMGLPRSNVHRTVRTLVEAGYARAHEDAGTYSCTLKLFELGSRVVRKLDVRLQADTVMQQLSSRTEETVHLAALEGREVVYLHKIDSPLPVRAYSEVGGRAPAYCVASGKALLASELHRLNDWPEELPKHTPRTVNQLVVLKEELQQAHSLGYAINRGEWRAEVAGIAAVVRDAAGGPVAALGVSGPVERLMPKIDQLIPEVLMSARTLSSRLGYQNYSGLSDERPTG